MDREKVQTGMSGTRLPSGFCLMLKLCRSATLPKELATTYPAPDDHIRTLYDILEHTVQRHPEVDSNWCGIFPVNVRIELTLLITLRCHTWARGPQTTKERLAHTRG